MNKNKQKYHTKESSDYNYQNSNFMNTNMNYMRKPNSEYNNKYNSNTYSNKYNSFKNKNHWKDQEDKDKKEEDIFLKKPMFTNSKLENNGNPEGNYIKIDLGGDNNIQKKSFNLINIGEIQINKNTNNSLSDINTNTTLKETEQKIEESNYNKNKEDIDLPWRTGGNNKKEYYNKKKESYYYNSNKNYNYNNYYNYNNRNNYPLNQPKSKKNNKFD